MRRALAPVTVAVTIMTAVALAAARARPLGAPAGAPTAGFLSPQQALAYHEFYFTRAIYPDGRGGFRATGYLGDGGPSWSTDFPKGDRQFMTVLNRLIGIDASPSENAVSLSDPDLRRFPFLYALEVGYMRLSEEDVVGLRSYLEAGGFLVIDDFWGPAQWDNFESEMSRVLPGRPIRDLPRDHPVFNYVYDVAEVIQVPNIANGISNGRFGTPTHQGYGSEIPRVLGIEDERGELMVLINWNTDLGDAWEHAENPYYPLRFSTFAFEMGINMIVYGMSH